MAKFLTSDSNKSGFKISEACGIYLTEDRSFGYSCKIQFTTKNGETFRFYSAQKMTTTDVGNILGVAKNHPDYAVEWGEAEDKYFETK